MTSEPNNPLTPEELARQMAELEVLRGTGALPTATLDSLLATLRAQQAAMQADLEGGGAIAQGGSIAVGQYGQFIVGNVYQGPAPRDDSEALAIYRRVVASACSALPLRGVDLQESDPGSGHTRMELAQVYVALDTTTSLHTVERLDRVMPERKMEPLPALRATALNRQLVLLGDPGSGKSTFVNHLALCLARHTLQPEGGWREQLAGWPEAEADLLPIVVILRDFARWLSAQPTSQTPRALWAFIEARLAEQNLTAAGPPLHAALERGEALLLLDGLDEIPERGQRQAVRDAVRAFATRYEGARLLVTCRTLSYQDPAWQLPGVPSFELAPFSEEQIDAFIGAWYGDLARQGGVRAEDAGPLAEELRRAVRRADLWRLAPNPLLLTVMALVHAHKGRLPDARATLYEDTVDLLLWRWEQVKLGAGQSAPRLRELLAEVGRGDVDLKRALWELAYEAHQRGGAEGETMADIGELRLLKRLAALHPTGDRAWGWQQVEAIRERAGLLVERAPELYTFPHRTFQEYLAGSHLAAQSTFAREAARLAGEGAFWREVILLAVGRLVYLGGDTDKPLALVGELCPRRAGGDETAWRKAWLAGEVLLEMGLARVQESQLGEDLLERVQERLVGLLRTDSLTVRERAEAGKMLARLGDVRFDAAHWYLPREPLLGFVEIPARPFLMGSDPAQDSEAYDREQPQHPVELRRYWIGRYPVTVAQWRAYVEASGDQPEYWPGLLGASNQPMVGITWHDALAYCAWLHGQLCGMAVLRLQGAEKDEATHTFWEGLYSGELRVTLPSEAEWGKAADGTDGRAYPWGAKITPEHANYDQTGIGAPNSVGIFPQGISPYGCEEMGGNVGEWTRSTLDLDDASDEREDLSRAARTGFFRHFDDGSAGRRNSGGAQALFEQIQLGAPIHLPLQAF